MYKKLEKLYTRLNNLGHLGAICGWDEQCIMPRGGADARTAAMTELSLLMHEMLTDPKVQGYVDKALEEKDTLNEWQRANLDIIAKGVKRTSYIPADLIEESSNAAQKCETAWRDLRKENNWKDYLPLLEKVVKYEREIATILSEKLGMSKYDAILDGYQDNLNVSFIDDMFNPLKEFLPDFIKSVVEKQKSEKYHKIEDTIPEALQKGLGEALIKTIGFDFNHGRLDISTHPFCGGVPEDVRLTTRYNEKDWTTSLMGVLHEASHGKYEQHLPKEWLSQPVGGALSMAVHESQSLFGEMIISRSLEFLRYAAPIIRKMFATEIQNPDVYTPENLYKIYTRVQPSYIRVDADEVTYPLHVILRYEIEKELVEGRIDTKDIPDIWDAKMQEYLGLSTKDNYKNGCMQDVHWNSGFGYFPAYTLGRMLSSQLFYSMKTEFPTIMVQVEHGDFATINSWLNKHIWSKGSLLTFDDLVEQATGQSLNPDFFIQNLTEKYNPSYKKSTPITNENVVDFHQLQMLRKSK